MQKSPLSWFHFEPSYDKTPRRCKEVRQFLWHYEPRLETLIQAEHSSYPGWHNLKGYTDEAQFSSAADGNEDTGYGDEIGQESLYSWLRLQLLRSRPMSIRLSIDMEELSTSYANSDGQLIWRLNQDLEETRAFEQSY